MKKYLSPNPVKPHLLLGSNYRETNCRFNAPTPERDYIRILECCIPCPEPVSDIYPGVKHPLQKMLRDMCREGLLERFTDGKRNYFVTTDKGFELFRICCRR